MSQFDFGNITPATKSGTQLASDLNAWRTALHSCHAGTARPSYAIGGTLWLDTTATPWILKMYDGAQDITVGTVNASTDTFTYSGALSSTGAIHSHTYTDPGAVGPQLDIYHNSSSPAVSDSIGNITISGNSSTGVKRTLGQISVQYTDPTNASEDADLYIYNRLAGSLNQVLQLSGTHTAFSGPAKPTANDGAALGVSGTGWSDVFFASGAVINFAAGDAALTHVTGGIIETTGVQRMSGSNSSPGVGTNGTGWALTNGGNGYFSAVGSAILANRTTDGAVITWGAQGVSQAVMSIAGTTGTYGAFNGSHEAQLSVESDRKKLLQGTILETVDEQCDWTGTPDVVLAKVQISRTPGSKRVYGVFFDWYDADPKDDTINGSSLGAYFVRIAKGVSVEGGDLIESNGDGCGRVQSDDLFRSSTVAKITSTVVAKTYKDGSYLVPCTLHCG